MQGPKLTRRELVATLRHEISKLQTLGAERPAAVRMIARKHRVPVERVGALIADEPATGGEL